MNRINVEEKTLFRNIGTDSMQTFTYSDPEGKIKASFSSLGMVTSIYVDGKIRYNRINGMGTVQIGEDERELIDRVYRDIESERFDQARNNSFRWHSSILQRRFEDWRELVEKGDIVPRCSDDTLILTASKGCPKSCSFCPMAESYSVADKETLMKRIDKLHTVIQRHHPNSSNLMKRGFIGGAGLSFLPHTSGKRFTSNELAELFKKRFSLEYVGGFMDTEQSLRIPLEYHRRLGKHVNQVYWGLESGSREFGALLDKHFTLEERRASLDHLLDAGYCVTPIIMTGLGRSTWYSDTPANKVRWYDALKMTTDIILSDGSGGLRPANQLSRINVEVSKLVVDEKTELGRSVLGGEPYRVKHKPERGRFVKVEAYESQEEILEERALIGKMFEDFVPVHFDYGADALPFYRNPDIR